MTYVIDRQIDAFHFFFCFFFNLLVSNIIRRYLGLIDYGIACAEDHLEDSRKNASARALQNNLLGKEIFN